MERPLAGRVAIVTGASRGIGKGCALELAAAGATVYVTGRSVREGDAALPGTVGATAAEIAAEGGSAVAVACDHRDDAAVEALFARVDSEQGRLDVLVNNAFLIPPELTSLMDNVVVLVEDDAPEHDPDLLGLYDGIALTDRTLDYGMVLPDRITIFRNPTLEMCESEDEVVEEVGITVVHEIAHHFGIDDDRLDELGWA